MTHNGRREDVTVYSNHVKKLLNSNSAENFEQTFNNLKVYWSQSFLNYFENHLKKDIVNHAGKWVLIESDLYHHGSGITTNASESFNAQLKRVINHKKIRMDEFMLSSYLLQNFTLNEILRGRCGLGDWDLNSKQFLLKLDETTFPSDIVDLTKIPEIVRGKKKEMDSTHQNRSIKNVPRPEGIATFLFENNRVSLNPSMKCFVVRGLNAELYAEQLFPKEKCSCVARKGCSHIRACQLAIGQKSDVSRTFNLSLLRKNSRGRNRAGRKKPRMKEDQHINVQGAPDSASKCVAKDDFQIRINGDSLEGNNLSLAKRNAIFLTTKACLISA